jgi:UDP-N-acetylmuramate dehydrogenase
MSGWVHEGPAGYGEHVTDFSAATSPEPLESGSVRLADLTTLRVGGPARRIVRARTTDALIDAVSGCDAAEEPVLVLGGGSNLLVGDDGFDGTVVLVATRGVELESADSCGGASLRVAAGEPWDDLVARAVASGWAGVEALSGIPGSTGATPVQNVGAYGQEVAETITSVRTWDRLEGRIRTFANVDCEFDYRHSRFKEERFAHGPRFVVLAVSFQLLVADLSAPVRYAELARTLGVEAGDRAPLAAVRDAVLGLRRSTGMVLDPQDPDTWSAGSFFTNPLLGPADAARLPDGAPRWPTADGRVKTSAAWLIERAGFGRGHGLPGAASLSTKHTLALTNRGTATAADLVSLAREVRDGVCTAFGIELVPEPVLVGCAL